MRAYLLFCSYMFLNKRDGKQREEERGRITKLTGKGQKELIKRTACLLRVLRSECMSGKLNRVCFVVVHMCLYICTNVHPDWADWVTCLADVMDGRRSFPVRAGAHLPPHFCSLTAVVKKDSAVREMGRGRKRRGRGGGGGGGWARAAREA